MQDMDRDIFINASPLLQNINDTIMKSAQAASEIKPTLQQVYNKFNRKLKSMGKDTIISSKEKPSKPRWIYSAGWKQFTQRLKMPKKIFQQQEKLLNKHMPTTFSPINNQDKNVDLSPDVEIIKITTVVEAIRQKRQKSAQMLEAAKNIQKIIGKKRSKRSSYESKNNSATTKNMRHSRQEKTVVSNKKSRSPKPHYRKQQTGTLPMRKHAADLKTANNIAIPSTVFYKRIWEYINGTRPHSDIISGYNSLENNSEKDNSTCTDKDRITASQSQEDKSQVTSLKPEQDFYKRIWDIINATKSMYGNTKARSKRNASTPKSNEASTPLCVQESATDYEEDKQVQSTNDKTSLDITDTINSPEISDSGPYVSGFWTIANKTQWQPKKIPVENIAKLNYDPILSSLVNSASEVNDLNKFPDKVENVGYLSSDNSTGHTNESHNVSQEIITEPGPPYSSEESFATFSLSPTESVVDKVSEEKARVKHAENYSTGTTPDYDPLNIPYVEVPDYSDQQEDNLDKNNQSTTAARHKEYDDYDYNPKQLYDVNDFSSKSPSAEIKVVQATNDEPEISLNANNSSSSCIESKDSPKCTDKYDVEDTKLHNNTEEVRDDINRSAENSAELALAEEYENSDFVDFDINEYRKPINWDEFYKNDPILKSITAGFGKENTEYDYKKNPDRTEESEEVETYSTDPKEQSDDYFPKNEDSYDNHRIAFDDRDKAKEETDSYAKKEAKKSETIDKDYYPYYNKDFFKHIFGKDTDKESEYDHKENPDRTEESEEVETYAADPKEQSQDYLAKNEDHRTEYDHKENPDRTEESEEVETYATDPKEQSDDYFPKNEDSNDNHRIASDNKDETKEETDSYAKKEAKESEEQIDEYYYPYNDEDLFKHIFRKDNDKVSSDAVNTENEFLSRHFTEDVLRQLRDNSTTEEDRQKEESRNREDIQKTLSKILDKKDHFSRLDDNLNKMIEKGETIPIKYNNFWSLEYESPGKRNKDNEEETEDSHTKEEA